MKFHNFIILILKTHFCKNHVSLFYFQKLQKSTKISKQREVLIKFKAINHITPEYNFVTATARQINLKHLFYEKLILVLADLPSLTIFMLYNLTI